MGRQMYRYDDEGIWVTRSQVWAVMLVAPLVLLAAIGMAYYAGLQDASMKQLVLKEISCAKLSGKM
jgi:hypothetical protein